MEGELRAQQLGGFGAMHRFALHLESTTNVHKVELNKKLCRDDADAGGRAHAYQVALPAVQEAKQLPLLRYESAPKFQPIPLRILLRWKFDEGRDKLEIRAATNPALKYGLKDVVLLVHVHDDVTGCQSKPQGEWKPHVLTWRVALLPPGKPSSFVAEFATPPGVSKEGRKAAPVQVSFACEDRCITGVTAKAADSAPVAAVLRKFQAGKYMVGPPLKDAPPKPAEG